MWLNQESQAFSQEEEKAVGDLLAFYESTPEGEWLQELDYERYRLYYSGQLSHFDRGFYRPWHGRRIFVKRQCFSAYFLAPVIIRELRYAWQFEQFPATHLFCHIPILRTGTIDCDAGRVAQDAERLLQLRQIRQQLPDGIRKKDSPQAIVF